MRLTDKHISDFQKLYLKEYGIHLSEDEATGRGSNLIELVRAVYKPITKEDYEKYSLGRKDNNTYAPYYMVNK